MEKPMNMNKPFIAFIALICLLLTTACDKDDVLPGGPMEWTFDITTPSTVRYEGGSVGMLPKYCFKACSLEGDIVMTCKNFPTLDPISGDSYTYDCGWATLTVEANRLKIHFPPCASDAPEAYEEITVTAPDGKRKATTVICLTRTFEAGEQPDPNAVPDAAKFKMTNAGFTPFMHIDSPLPAPLDLITFRITDINDHYTPIGMPDFTQYYDSIVWSADAFPHTFRVYESETTADATEQHFTSQWSSHFFRKGTITTRLKGYIGGEVRYETAFKLNLYERDFLGLEWGTIVLQKPENLTDYCLLDTDYEYQTNDITAIGANPFSRIIPVNHKHLPHADFMTTARKAITTLMETNIGPGQNAAGKASLFKCLPDDDVEALLYWENKTTRILMLHQLPSDPDHLPQENYYLHLEPLHP